MKRFIQCAMVVAILSIVSAAQAPAPAAQAPAPSSEGNKNLVYGGFVYAPTDWGGAWTDFKGFDVNYSRDIVKHFAVVADFDWIRNNQSQAGDLDLGNPHDATAWSLGFGPRYNLLKRDHRVQPYVVALFGGAHLGALFPYPTHASPLAHTTWSGFTWSAGGGVDFRLTRHFGVRGEWLHVSEPWGDLSTHSDWDRISFGGSWRF